MKLHRPFQTMALAGLLAGAFAPACSADLIYQDNFTSPAGPLNGMAPTTDRTGAHATWTASAGYNLSGTNLLVNNSGGDWQGAAKLPLDWLTTYHDPRVQVDMKLGQAGDWATLDFGDCDYYGYPGMPAFMILHGNGDVDVCQGPGWAGDFIKATFAGAGSPLGWTTLRIEYSNTLQTANFYVNGTLLTNIAVPDNAPLSGGAWNTGVGLNGNCGVDAQVTNFVVTFASETNFPPDITVQPQGETIFVGDPINVSLQATGTLPMQYTWYRDTVALPDHNGNVLNLSPAALSDSGDYKVVIQNAYGSITSRVVRVDVHLEAQTPLAQINFDDITNNLYEFAFAYASDPIVQDALVAATGSTNVPGVGVGDSAGLRLYTDGSGFELGTVAWAGFGGGVGLALPKLATGNLDFFEFYASARIENLVAGKTNTPGRIALRFYTPDPSDATKVIDVCDVVQSVTYSSNYQAYAFILNRANYGGDAGQTQMSLNFSNVVRVQMEFTLDNFYTDFREGPGTAVVLDNLKLAFRQSPAISATFDGTQAVIHWDDPNVQLLGAVDVGGPYVAIPGASSPYPVPAASPYHFFRTGFTPVP